jgi:hypothetical protein
MQTPDGQTFYYHQPSNTSHWSVPSAPTSQGYRQCPSSAAADFSRPSQRPASACVHGARGGGGSGPRLSDLSPDELELVVRVYDTFSHATLSNTIRFQMSGLNHTKYAQAVKRFQIRGIVLANANQGELSAIFRYDTHIITKPEQNLSNALLFSASNHFVKGHGCFAATRHRTQKLHRLMEERP